jgi:hypothetical protein
MSATRVAHPQDKQVVANMLEHFLETPGIMGLSRFMVFDNPPGEQTDPDTADAGTQFPSSTSAAVDEISNNSGDSWLQAIVAVKSPNGPEHEIGPAALEDIFAQVLVLQLG